MTPDEYAAQQAILSAATANYVMQFGKFFVRPVLGIAQWISLLQLLFPEVKQRREQSSELARTFYDFQRKLAHPLLPTNARELEPYEFQWFVRNMEPARKRMSQEDSPVDAVPFLAARAVREVENAGRRQIIKAVENEPEPRIIRGWARVATGRETCAWCLMLISRGPVYQAASTAGLNLDDTTAERMIAAGTDVTESMDEWHELCDCKVVPVFKKEDWFGQEASDQALKLWNRAAKAAETRREEEPDRVHPSGKKKGLPFTLNEDTINVLRQILEHEQIDQNQFAALAA